MPDTMIERVARVLCAQDGDDPDRICAGEGKAAGRSWPAWWAYHSNARSIIAAMREPGPRISRAGHLALADFSEESLTYQAADRVFTAMIDAALVGTETKEIPTFRGRGSATITPTQPGVRMASWPNDLGDTPAAAIGKSVRVEGSGLSTSYIVDAVADDGLLLLKPQPAKGT